MKTIEDAERVGAVLNPSGTMGRPPGMDKVTRQTSHR